MEVEYLASLLAPGTDRASPLYGQIYGRLRGLILDRDLATGTRLPATRNLANSLRVSRNTVKLAYEMLQAEGYVTAMHGAGTYVAEIEGDVLQGALGRGTASPALKPAISDRASSLTRVDRASILGAPRAFQPGVPAVDLFPHALWGRILGRTARQPDLSVLGDSFQSSLPVLKEALASYLSVSRGVRAGPEQIVVTPTAQAAFDLIARIVLDPGDTVWLENPCYLRAWTAFAASGANVLPVNVDDEGMDVSRAPPSQPKLIYVSPSHHCPTGVTMPLKRRLELLEAAMSAGAFVVEDDYDSEIHYDGRPVAALQGIGGGDHVIYVGTFSKTMMPAVRAGYIVAPAHIVRALEAAQRYTGHILASNIQAGLAAFIAGGHYRTHIRRMREVYRKRRALLVSLLQDEVTPWCDLHVPSGGLQLALLFKQPVYDVALARDLARAGVACLPVSRNYLRNPKRGLYLGFGAPDEAEIARGVALLSSVLKRQFDA